MIYKNIQKTLFVFLSVIIILVVLAEFNQNSEKSDHHDYISNEVTQNSNIYKSTTKEKTYENNITTESSTSISKSYNSNYCNINDDEYNAKDYGNEEDFYEDNYDDFDSLDDAEDYWMDHND